MTKADLEDRLYDEALEMGHEDPELFVDEMIDHELAWCERSLREDDSKSAMSDLAWIDDGELPF